MLQKKSSLHSELITFDNLQKAVNLKKINITIRSAGFFNRNVKTNILKKTDIDNFLKLC